jgi:hypothetical protein
MKQLLVGRRFAALDNPQSARSLGPERLSVLKIPRDGSDVAQLGKVSLRPMQVREPASENLG